MPSINRRDFLKGIAAAGTIGAASALAGCSPASPSSQQEKPMAGTGENEEASSYDISETVDVDVVVAGAGNAGMAATVEAADLGLSVLLLEKEPILGGNGNYTYGPSGFNTKYSRAAGIDYDWRDAVVEDQHMFNFIPNIHYYIDMAKASSDNIDWVADHGVPISHIVDNYKGGNNTMHYWGETGGEIDPVHGRVGSETIYIEGMQKAAEALGVEIRTSTPAVDIIKEGDVVKGIIAQDKSGKYIQVNAKAVILATGGICADEDLMRRAGRNDPIVSTYTFCEGCTGDGFKLATKAGAFDTFATVGFIEQPAFAEMGYAENKAMEEGLDASFYPNENDQHPVWNILKHGRCIWVNEMGERFADESIARPEGGVAGHATNAFLSQRKAYAIVDKALQDEMGEDCMQFMLDANNYGTKFQADTLDELAASMGIPADTLKETVTTYNESCTQGKDLDFGKHAEALVPIGDGPYFATQLSVSPLCSTGGVRVNRQMQACDVDWNPINGLYVIGVDSFPFYTQMYYFQLPGSAVAYELHSGLVAARHIKENLA